MKFWLNEGSDAIYLDQVIKALGFADNYPEIRRMIDDGKVKVNGAVEYKRRKSLYEDDVIELEGKKITILGKKEEARKKKEKLLKEAEEERKLEHVVHGKTQTAWKEFTVKKKK